MWMNYTGLNITQLAHYKLIFINFRIVETMSYSDKVANFLEAPPSELDSLNIADLELIVGDVMERVRSESNSPLG